MSARVLRQLAVLPAVILVCLCLAPPVFAQTPSIVPLPVEPRRRLETLRQWPGIAAPTSEVTAASPHDTFFDPWSKLTYQRYINGNWEIFFSAASGAGEVQLTNNDAPDIAPKLNRGATAVVFTSTAHSLPSNAAWEVYTVNVDGSGLRRLTVDAAQNTAPAWSWDGKQIVYTSQRTGNEDLYVMNADGSNQRRLTDDPSGDSEAAWSRSGKIAWVRSAGGLFWLLAMNADGSNQRIAAGPLPYIAAPVWNMQGTYLAFAAELDQDGFTELASLAIAADNTPGQVQNDDVGCPPKVSACDYLAGGWYSEENVLYATRVSYTISSGKPRLVAIQVVSVVSSDEWTLGAAYENGLSSYTAANADWNTTDVTPPVLRIPRVPRLVPYADFSILVELMDETSAANAWSEVELLDAAYAPIVTKQVYIKPYDECVTKRTYCFIARIWPEDLRSKNVRYIRARARDQLLNATTWYDVTPEPFAIYDRVNTLHFVDGRQAPVPATILAAPSTVAQVTPMTDTATATAWTWWTAGVTVTAPGMVTTAAPSIEWSNHDGHIPQNRDFAIMLTPAGNRITGGSFDAPDDLALWQVTGESVIADGLLHMNGNVQCVNPAALDCEPLYTATSVSQTVSLSPTLQNPTLSFVYNFGGDFNIDAYRHDWGAQSGELAVTVQDATLSTTQVFTAALLLNAAYDGWQPAWVDLALWSGRSVTVTFTYTPALAVNGARYSRMYGYLDNVAVASWTTPVVYSYSPRALPSHTPGTLTLRGENITASSEARLGTTALGKLQPQDDGSWTTAVPAIDVPGLYNLFVTGEQDTVAVAPGALRVGLANYLPQAGRDATVYARPAP